MAVPIGECHDTYGIDHEYGTVAHSEFCPARKGLCEDDFFKGTAK